MYNVHIHTHTVLIIIVMLYIQKQTNRITKIYYSIVVIQIDTLSSLVVVS